MLGPGRRRRLAGEPGWADNLVGLQLRHWQLVRDLAEHPTGPRAGPKRAALAMIELRLRELDRLPRP